MAPSAIDATIDAPYIAMRKVRLVCGTMKAAGTFDGLVTHERPIRTTLNFLSRSVIDGINTFDTSPIYAKGGAERSLGHLSQTHKIEVWTKVGVDISGVVPRLDYSYNGYWASLRSSLERLGSATIGTIFLHNPQRQHILSDEFLEFSKEAIAQSLCHQVGYSCISESAIRLAASVLPSAQIMLEAAQLKSPTVAKIGRALEDRLIVRSLFQGGTSFRLYGTPSARRRYVLLSASAILAEFPAATLVLAPYTSLQLRDYSQLIKSCI